MLQRNKWLTLIPKNFGVTLRSKGGFTLIELLIVVLIIGIIATLVVANFKDARARSRDARRASDIWTLQSGLAIYHNEYQNYPFPYDGPITGGDLMSQALENEGIMSVPIDPINGLLGGQTYQYYYQDIDSGKSYVLKYYLETNSIQGRAQGENWVVP